MFRATHRRTSGFVLGLCIGLILSGCATAPSSSPSGSPSSEKFNQALAHYSQGLIYEDEHSLKKANESFERAIELDPTHADSYKRATRNYIRLGEHKKAGEIAEQLVKIDPKSLTNRLWLAKTHLAAYNTDKAVKAYRDALKINKTHVQTQSELAALLIATEKEEEALELIRKSLKKSPDPAQLLNNLGTIYLKQAQVEENEDVVEHFHRTATDLYDRALKHHPKDPDLVRQLGDIYLLSKDLDRATQTFQKLVDLQPMEALPRQKLAYAYILAGEEDQAIHTLEELATQDPENSSVYFYLGELFLQIGDKENAMVNFARAAKREGEPRSMAYLKLALLQMEDELPEVEDTLKEAIEALPKDTRLHEMYSYYLLNQEKYDEAVPVFADTAALLDKEGVTPQLKFYLYYALGAQRSGNLDIALDQLIKGIPIHPELLDRYAEFILREKDEDEQQNGLDLLSQLAEKGEDSSSIYSYIGLIHNSNEEYEKAVKAFEAALDVKDESDQKRDSEDLPASFYFWYGAARERLQQYDEAEVLFEKCIELDDQHAEAYNYLAYMWAERSMNLDQAELYVGRALALDPGNAAFLDTLGWVFYQRGQYQIARKHIEQAQEIINDDPTIIEHLGDIAIKQNRKDDAIRFWTQSFEIDPSNDNVRNKLTEQGVNLPEPEAAEPEVPVEDDPVIDSDPPEDAEPSPESDSPISEPESESVPAE